MSYKFKVEMEVLQDRTVTSGAIIFFATFNCVIGAYCGTIQQPQVLPNTPDSVLIHFKPNANFTSLVYRTDYRWIYNNVIVNFGDKYGLNGTSLIIHDVGKSDEGLYKVDCRYYEEVSVELRLDNGSVVNDQTTFATTKPAPGTTIVTTTEGITKHSSTITAPAEPPTRAVGETSGSVTLSNENITVIVVSLSALGIAIVVAVLIKSKRNRSNQEGGETLVNRKKDISLSLAGDDDYNQTKHTERYVSGVIRDSTVVSELNSGSDYALIDETLMIDMTANCDAVRQQGIPRVGSSCSGGEAAYSNITKAPKKQKGGAQAPEITYVTLEHDVAGVSCPPDVTDREVNVDKGNLTKEYAIIDFAREAFVAPIRKAPSSWYKRKKKGKS